jgi:hypothetical protein
VRGAGPGEAVWLLISPDGEATTSSHGPCSLADESFTCEDASFGGIADGGKRYHARAVLVDHEGQDKLVRDMEFQPIAESKPVTVTRH